MPDVLSIIMCSRDDARFASAKSHLGASLSGTLHEIIRIPDARSLAEGYNRGIDQSTGEILIFSHDDIELLKTNWPARIETLLSDFDLIGIAGTTRLMAPTWQFAGPPYCVGQVAHPDEAGFSVGIFSAPARVVGSIQALDGAWFCAKRGVAQSIRFDEKAFPGFHLYDLDFTFRAFRAGHRLAVCNDLFPIHASSGDYTDPAWMTAAEAFMKKHADALAPTISRKWAASWVNVQTREQVIEVMTPPWWGKDHVF